ncbi:hypothetical protein U1Q18_032300 [Sarracenia purpurea var. burkii]
MLISGKPVSGRCGGDEEIGGEAEHGEECDGTRRRKGRCKGRGGRPAGAQAASLMVDEGSAGFVTSAVMFQILPVFGVWR